MTFFGGKGLKGGSGMKGLMPGALEGMNHGDHAEGMLLPSKSGFVQLTNQGGGRRRRRRGTKRRCTTKRSGSKRRGSKRRGTTKRRKTHKRKH